MKVKVIGLTPFFIVKTPPSPFFLKKFIFSF